MKDKSLSYFLYGLAIGIGGSLLGILLHDVMNPEPKVRAGYVTDAKAKSDSATVARRSFYQGVYAGADAVVEAVNAYSK